MAASSDEMAGSFRPLDTSYLAEYIRATPAIRELLGLGPENENLDIKEVGDGNLNFVYIVLGPSGSLVIKQALPYIRSLGESFPMSKERAYFEMLGLKKQGSLCPDHVPRVHHFDRAMSLIAMRYIEPPHIVLRKGLIAGMEYPLLADHMSEFLARTLFFTSLLHHSTTEHRLAVAEFCGNAEMCSVAEQVVFSNPYELSDFGQWTSPYLDDDARAVREDDDLKLEIAALKSMFCETAQSLIHGDLHTGSVMATANSTQVIDPEYAFYGPMGFDIGLFLGNLMLAFFAQDGHAQAPGAREKYKKWILKTIEDTWNLFHTKFISIWDEHKDGTGDAYLSTIYNKPELLKRAQSIYLKDLFYDSLGFCGANMIRALVVIVKVEDFESIADISRRVHCERRALHFGKMLLKERRRFLSIEEMTAALATFLL